MHGMLYALSSTEGLILPGCSESIVYLLMQMKLFLLKNQSDVDILADIIKNFTVVSAARVNWKKVKPLLSVSPSSSPAWKKDGQKYLGVFLGNETMVLKNWENVTEKIEEN